ncbi:MAG TPA: helix-turn-helix domain-containing protein [Myxococcus sp.]|nr:helix-turn-helix domain-containing protein [Myxococcus sp.]
MTTEPVATESFARRVRGLLDAKKHTIAELADRAELAASLVSKLLTDTDAARREPRLEHILAMARALEVTPRELVLGTTAEAQLGEWIPRTEFDEESKARSTAQTESARLRTELAGARSEAAALKTSVDQLTQELAAVTRRLSDVETRARQEQTAIRVSRASAEAKLASALVERDEALAQAQQNYQAWAKARSQILQLQREVADAQGAASAGWITAILGTVSGAILGSAASQPSAPRASTSRKRTRRRA